MGEWCAKAQAKTPKFFQKCNALELAASAIRNCLVNYFSFCRAAERNHTSKKLKMKTVTVRLLKLQHTRLRYTLVPARSNLQRGITQKFLRTNRKSYSNFMHLFPSWN